MSRAAATTSAIDHRCALGLLAPGHREEGADDPGAALGRGANLLRRRLRRCPALLLEEHGARDDDDSGLLSSCATPASNEPSAASFSRWCSASRCRASSSTARLRSVMSRGDRQNAIAAADGHALHEHLVPAQGAVAMAAVPLDAQWLSGGARAMTAMASAWVYGGSPELSAPTSSRRSSSEE